MTETVVRVCQLKAGDFFDWCGTKLRVNRITEEKIVCTYDRNDGNKVELGAKSQMKVLLITE